MRTVWMLAIVVWVLGACSGRASAEGTTPAEQKLYATEKAETAMLNACKKGFPDKATGKTVEQVDQWAEAQEHAADSAAFKKSPCYRLHEKWEKLAGKNEWAADGSRLPAAAK